MKIISILFAILFAANAVAADGLGYLVQLKNGRSLDSFKVEMGLSRVQFNDLGINNWVKLDISEDEASQLANRDDVALVEKNITFKIMTNFEVTEPALKAQLQKLAEQEELTQILSQREDNPEIPLAGSGGSGADPLYSKQWGMVDNNLTTAWSQSGTKGSEDVIVAVLDTGVDYTHEDLVDNMWRNPGEMGRDENGNQKATNGIDDDNNGFVDDVVGWDFVTNDNKPYDLSVSGIQVLFGGNPGHGTHCAGNVAARGDNGKGIAGVANVQIMAMRFLSEKGEGTLEGAVQSIKYAVDNGAQILSNSWGSEGDGGAEESQALRDAIQYSLDKGTLFVAAAGNGREGKGYDNDSDSKPAYPASYPFDNIVSVAALDNADNLGAFSNWGRRTVDLGAPGVSVFSTVPNNVYQDTVIDIPGLITATWDGTSMATPHVSGAAALYLSKNPNADYREMKQALLNSVTAVPAMNGKSISNGKLNVLNLMAQ